MIKQINLPEIRQKNIKIPGSIPVLANYYYYLQGILNSNCFLEIGAFEAEFSRRMKTMFPFSHVYAFEASPYCYEFNKNINTSINYLNIAVSDKNGEIEFCLQDKYVSDNSEINKVVGNNSILNRNDDSILYKKISIKSITFDTFIEENNLTDTKMSLWIDVEGATKNVLTGSTKYIDNVQSLLIEVEDYEYWKNQWLSKDVDHYLQQYNFIPIVRDFEDNNQYDVVYINKKILNKELEQKIQNWINTYLNHWGLSNGN